MKVALAARSPDKQVMKDIAQAHGVKCYPCDASNTEDVQALFNNVRNELGEPSLVVFNIDGRAGDIFRKRITEVDPVLVKQTLLNSSFGAFLVGSEAARGMLQTFANKTHKGSILFTGASASFKGFPLSGAFAMASHGKSGLAQSMARELGPQGIHVAHFPIDGAIGWTQEDGTRKHWAAGVAKEDNMLDPAAIAETYLQVHRQPRSTWAYEVVLRPYSEKW
jgi:NAD(P)-dependent dehydrogenase (short-subunit alcohol dehydrogenase family)